MLFFLIIYSYLLITEAFRIPNANFKNLPSLQNANNNHPSTTTTTANSLDGKPISGPITPLMDGLLVKPAEPPSYTSGGLYLPEEERTPSFSLGTIIRMGSGLLNPQTGKIVDAGLKIGDVVVYNSTQGSLVNYNEEEMLVLGSLEIVAKLKNQEFDPLETSPLYDMVLVKISEAGAATLSGLIIDENSKKSVDGLIVGVGPGAFSMDGNRIPIDVSVGEKVRLKNGVYNERKLLRYKEEDYMFLRISEILLKWL